MNRSGYEEAVKAMSKSDYEHAAARMANLRFGAWIYYGYGKGWGI